jgi:capsular exopolysaccharide synthesis family protein
MHGQIGGVQDMGAGRALLIDGGQAFSAPASPDDSPWNILRRRSRLALSVFACAFAVAAAFVLMRPDKFEAAAILMMSPSAPEGVMSSNEEDRLRPPDSGYVDSQVEILNSPGLAASLVDRLHLERDREFGGGGSHPDRGAVVNAVAEAIDARRRRGTYVVEVGVTTGDREKSAIMANTLVELYLASNVDARVRASERTREWLGRRLVELRADLQQREAEVEAFRAQTGILNVGGVALSEQQMRDAEASLVEARTDLAERQARYSEIHALERRGGSLESIGGALTSDVMVALRAREADVDRRLAEYADRYGDIHPSVIAAHAERDDIERQIRMEVHRLTENLGIEADVARARVSALQGHLGGVRQELVSDNAQMVRVRELERGAAAARGVYEAFLQRHQELADGAAGVGGEAQLITEASPPPHSVSKSTPLMLGVAFALAAILGAMAALIAERFSSLVNTADDVERKTGLSLLTSIPLLKPQDLKALPDDQHHPAGFANANQRSAFTESVRLLRSRIVRGRLHPNVKVVAMASAVSGEGKTSTALTLARVAAWSGQRVLVIDCDVRGSALNALLGIDPKFGIVEALRGEAAWRSIVGCDDFSPAHIIPASNAGFTNRDVFGSREMIKLIEDVSREYDLVLLDTPPILALAEARDIALLADGVVLVARSGKTSVAALRTACRELDAIGANVLGVALNGVDENAPGRSSYADPLYFSHAQKAMYSS